MSTATPQPETANLVAALEHFVVDNDDLLALEERIGRFNIFDALGIVRAEIRHSNYLAWLLDPNESHGQGPLFLKAVLMDLLRQSPAEGRLFSPIELDGNELRGVEVRREWKNIDILITCDEPQFVIAIENKIDSSEHSEQLTRYKTTVHESFGLMPRQFVFLTREGDEPTDEEWTVYTYRDIHRTLQRVRKANAANIGDDVLTFLDHYLNLIGSRFMDDAKIDELCRTIYKNHRQAIDLIMERCGSSETRVVSIVRSFVEEHPDLQLLRGAAKSVMFIPKAWRSMLPAIGQHPGRDQYPDAWIDVLVQARRNKLRLRPTIRAASDDKLRRKVIELLTDPEMGFGFARHGRAKRISPTMTRIGNEAILGWKDDEIPEEKVIRAKLSSAIDAMLKRTVAMPDQIQRVIEGH